MEFWQWQRDGPAEIFYFVYLVRSTDSTMDSMIDSSAGMAITMDPVRRLDALCTLCMSMAVVTLQCAQAEVTI